MIKRQELDFVNTKILLEIISSRLNDLNHQIARIKDIKQHLEKEFKRFSTPLAKIKDGVKIQPYHIVVFTEGEAKFGHYEHDEFIEEDWPLESDSEYIWPDDCENLGIRWEEV